MDEYLTMAEIKERYDGEWVIIDQPELDGNRDVSGGKLVFHSKDRLEVDRKSLELRLHYSAVLYIGRITADMVYVL